MLDKEDGEVPSSASEVSPVGGISERSPRSQKC